LALEKSLGSLRGKAQNKANIKEITKSSSKPLASAKNGSSQKKEKKSSQKQKSKGESSALPKFEGSYRKCLRNNKPKQFRLVLEEANNLLTMSIPNFMKNLK
jgi:hypothetical protein